MTETQYYIDQIATQVLNISSVFRTGYTNVFLDTESNEIMLRQSGNSNEYVRFGANDSLGNFFYIRYRGRESWTIQREIKQLASDQFRQIERIPLKIVGLFTEQDLYEVADGLRHDMLMVHLPNYMNAGTAWIEQEKVEMDYLNASSEESEGRFRSYAVGLQSIAVEFTLVYSRSGECRQPAELL